MILIWNKKNCKIIAIYQDIWALSSKKEIFWNLVFPDEWKPSINNNKIIESRKKFFKK